jgi:hypothetical protein
MWVLILFYLSSANASVAMHDFASQAACEHAREVAQGMQSPYAPGEHHGAAVVEGGAVICKSIGCFVLRVRIAGWPRLRPTFFAHH